MRAARTSRLRSPARAPFSNELFALALPALALLAATPSIARAESAIVLVPEVEGRADALADARSAAIEVLAERAIRLVRTPDGEPCEEVACAQTLAAETGANFVAILSLEVADDGSERMHVILVPATGDPREATEPIGTASIAGATTAAFVAALREGSDGRMGFLMVRTNPPGASVAIDGSHVGETPLRRMLSPGSHEVRIGEGGARTRTVEVRPLEETALDIDLAGEDADEDTGAGPAGERRTEPSPFNWIIGGALAIGGVVALISPLQTIATHGQCVELIERVGCLERVQFGAQSGILLGIGVAAIIAAVVVDAVAPIRVDVSASPEGAILRVEGWL